VLGRPPGAPGRRAEDPAAIEQLLDAVWWGHPPSPPGHHPRAARAALPATVYAFEDSDGTFYSVECREEAATIDADEALRPGSCARAPGVRATGWSTTRPRRR
jgi:hypothetical protein